MTETNDTEFLSIKAPLRGFLHKQQSRFYHVFSAGRPSAESWEGRGHRALLWLVVATDKARGGPRAHRSPPVTGTLIDVNVTRIESITKIIKHKIKTLMFFYIRLPHKHVRMMTSSVALLCVAAQKLTAARARVPTWGSRAWKLGSGPCPRIWRTSPQPSGWWWKVWCQLLSSGCRRRSLSTGSRAPRRTSRSRVCPRK